MGAPTQFGPRGLAEFRYTTLESGQGVIGQPSVKVPVPARKAVSLGSNIPQ
jgi:hypothetical protein